MRKPLVAGNWKMHGDMSSTTKLLDGILSGLPTSNSIDIAVFPPFPYLAKAVEILGDSPVQCGAQNMSDSDEGAFTGEVSASMLKDVGCHYVLVGHSERRTNHKETSELVAQKAEVAHKESLISIICIGETEAERENGSAYEVVKEQLLASIPKSANDENTVIAYEPVWAIGTNKVPTENEIKEMHQFIVKTAQESLKQFEKNITVLYGGSANEKNAKKILSLPSVDGLLIGRASLEAESLWEILQIAESA